MKRKQFEKIPVEKLSAYLDGTLNKQETVEMDALVDSDEELQAVVDEYLSIQFELADSDIQQQEDTTINLTALRSIQSAMLKVNAKEDVRIVACPASSASVATNEVLRKHFLRILLGAACVIFAVVVNIILFSPATIVEDGCSASPISRDVGTVFGEDLDYESKLAEIDSLIKVKESELPVLPSLDRYNSEKRRKEISRGRKEVYELQWRRIFLLLQLHREKELKSALKKFVRIDGCHRDEAVDLLHEL